MFVVENISDFRQGTQVLLRWAEWQRSHDFPKPTITAIFHKEGARLIVCQYEERVAVCIKCAFVAPKLRDFREWRQSYDVIKEKLVRNGWELQSEQEEINYDVH